jgi:hypothetical protein
MVYQLSMTLNPRVLPNADVALNQADQVIFENGQARSPEWIWEVKAHPGFEKATITLSAQLRAYETDADWRAHNASGSPDTVVVPLATFDIRKPPPAPSRAFEVTAAIWHWIVDVFGVIGAIPTVLLWPRARRWTGAMLTSIFSVHWILH